MNPLSPLPAGQAPLRLPRARKAASLPMRRGLRSAFLKSLGHFADRAAARRSTAAIQRRRRQSLSRRRSGKVLPTDWPPRDGGAGAALRLVQEAPGREPTRGQQPGTRHSSWSRRKEGVRARPAANVAASQEGQVAAHRCGSRVPVAPMPIVGLPDRRAGLGRTRSRPTPPPPSGRICSSAAIALRA